MIHKAMLPTATHIPSRYTGVLVPQDVADWLGSCARICVINRKGIPGVGHQVSSIAETNVVSSPNTYTKTPRRREGEKCGTMLLGREQEERQR